MGNKCHNCGKFRHHAKDCWLKKKNKDKDKRIKRNWNGEKQGENETNVGEYIAFPVKEELHNFVSFDACNTRGIDECLIYYNWLVDSAMTSHISHQHDAFTTYTSMGNKTIMGVGMYSMCLECEITYTYNYQFLKGEVRSSIGSYQLYCSTSGARLKTKRHTN